MKSAADEFNLHPKTARNVLIAAGLLDHAASIGHAHQQVVDAVAEEILSRYATLMPLPGVQEYLGINRVLGAVLVRTGLLPPVVPSGRGQGAAPTYAVRDVDALADRLLDGAEVLASPPPGCDQIAKSLKRLNCSWTELLDLILERKIWRGRLQDHPGIEGILVRIDEVAAFVRAGDIPGFQLPEVATLLDTTVAAVGVLVRNGLMPTVTARKPFNRCPMRIVPADVVEAFDLAYVGAVRSASMMGCHSSEIAATLAKVGISPAIGKDRSGAPWLLRKDVERWFDSYTRPSNSRLVDDKSAIGYI
ncbi:MAG: hypothetical protein NTW00_10705 [Hyphomicrobiales bacterium]|nr:hypothetical protein [Hyphomicrobiales bacterium]